MSQKSSQFHQPLSRQVKNTIQDVQQTSVLTQGSSSDESDDLLSSDNLIKKVVQEQEKIQLTTETVSIDNTLDENVDQEQVEIDQSGHNVNTVADNNINNNDISVIDNHNFTPVDSKKKKKKARKQNLIPKLDESPNSADPITSLSDHGYSKYNMRKNNRK